MVTKSNAGTNQNEDHTGVQSDGFDYWRLTNRGGIVAVFLSLAILNGSHVLYVKPKLENREPTLIVRALDIIALIGLVGGLMAFVVSFFLPTGKMWRQDTPKDTP